MKDWSSLRPALQDILFAALQKASAELPAGGSFEEVLGNLMEELARSGKAPAASSESSQDGPIARCKRVIADKRKIAVCKKFLLQNNDKNFTKHPALLSCLKFSREAFCQCPRPDEWDSPTAHYCEFHDQRVHHTLNDILWGLAKMLEKEDLIPAAVCEVGHAAMAVAVHVDTMLSTATCKEDTCSCSASGLCA